MTKLMNRRFRNVCGIFIVAGVIVFVAAAKHSQPVPDVDISGDTKACVTCHAKRGVAPNLSEEWKRSRHAAEGVGCLECHTAEAGDFDEYICPGSSYRIAKHPTPKDCSVCHEQAVAENANSKHAVSQVMMSLKGADRNVFEPTLATKHGCEQCHQIGNYWPDGSVGECDACHSKHRFDIAQARRPETCGECHVGPDHPHIEIFMESKHGNLYATYGDEYDWNYPPGDPVTFAAPTCATCHMSAAGKNVKFTHNVSDRLAWESQAPLSVRTQPYWGGITWQEKRARMTAVCNQCHAPSFADRYLLVADLCNLQYNEIWQATVGWMKQLREHGIVQTDQLLHNGKPVMPWPVTGYDEDIEHTTYRNWHHEGRRFRHGSEMMGADYTQWHGIWELQENLVKIIEHAAAHGIAEAKAWMVSTDANKLMQLYPLYDVPGSTWGPSALAYRGTMPMDRLKDYWPTVYANVKAAYDKGVLTDGQWKLYEALYANRENEIGRNYALPAAHDVYMENLTKDLKELYPQQQVKLKKFE